MASRIPTDIRIATTLAELESRNIPALRTDQQGLICIWTDGYRLHTETQEP